MPKFKHCTVCDTEFEVRPAYYAKSKYCSSACFGKSRRTQQERRCRNCGDSFMFKPSQLHAYPNAGKYCSRKCGYEYRVKLNANRPSKDLYTRTKRKADIIWATAIKVKYEKTCQRCGVYGEGLHAHHIMLRSQRPDLKHEISNGTLLCGTCHQWVHHNPAEAKKLGLIGGVSYVKAQNEKRYKIQSEQNKNRYKGSVHIQKCTNCGKEKRYTQSATHLSTTQYRCQDCYTRVHYRRKTADFALG